MNLTPTIIYVDKDKKRRAIKISVKKENFEEINCFFEFRMNKKAIERINIDFHNKDRKTFRFALQELRHAVCILTVKRKSHDF